jgi:MinD-like ATPase involved in chromosome partitioning or flagellar assembly
MLPRHLGWLQRVGLATGAALRTRRESGAPMVLHRPPSAGERFRHAWQESDYVTRLDAAIRRPRLAACATIAVISPKGGVGKTTISALLGTLFADLRSDRVVAVDTNPDFGSLGRSLVPDHQLYLDELLEVLNKRSLTVTGLDSTLGRAAHGLMVIPAPDDPARMGRLGEDAYARAIKRLQELVGIIVLDCGTGLQDGAVRAALELADQLVLVSDADPATAQLVADAGRLLEERDLPILLVVNKLPERHLRLDVAAFAAGVPSAVGLVTLPQADEAAARLSQGKFDWRNAPAGWQTGIRELATTLVGDWRELGLTREADAQPSLPA